MRKEVRQELRNRFREALERGGRFHRTRQQAAPGTDIYIWEYSPNLHCFVYLLPSPKSYYDKYMVELGWSSGESFPERARLQHSRALDLRVDGRIRLPSLWRDEWATALEPWWKAGPSLVETGDVFDSDEETARRVARVPELVRDTIDRLERYAVPFFHRVAEQRASDR